ncbi:MAG: alpha/beta hydrolase [Glaciecola sp.]|jgi:enterochelin esterase-like enzyme
MKSILMSFVASLLILSGCSEVKKSIDMSVDEAPHMMPTPSQGEIIATLRFPSQHISERDVFVWIPAGYQEAVTAGVKFATLYMHDGQMLFDGNITWNKQEWHLDEIAHDLITTQQTVPFIIIGINNAGDELRYVEYMPQKPFESLSNAQQADILKQTSPTGETVYSDRYLQFLTDELKPYIDHNYATLPDRQNTYIGGASMGGLISMYAVAEYPDVFGGCICMSTHLIGGPNLQDWTVYEAFESYMVAKLPINGSHRLYFDYGTQTLDEYYPPYHDRLRQTLTEINAHKHVQIIKYDRHAHDEASWSSRIHIPLKKMFN